MISTVGVSRANVNFVLSGYAGARCTIWHFSRIYKRVEYEDYIAASSVLALPHLLSKWILKSSLYLGYAKSQNLARLREIAKINTRKIIGTRKSQNFVLANNSNIKVYNKPARMLYIICNTESSLAPVLSHPPPPFFLAQFSLVRSSLVHISQRTGESLKTAISLRLHTKN